MHFSTFALVGVIMLVLSGTSFIFLLRVRNKSRSSYMLLWFFLCVSASAVATILTNSGTSWCRAFAPAQDGLLIMGSVFMVRFAYFYPSDDQPSERRLFTIIFSLLSAVVLGYVTLFAIRYFLYLPGKLEEDQAFYLVTPLVLFTLILIVFSRSGHWSAKIPRAEPTRRINFFQRFIHPSSQPAIALRNYGLAMSVGLIPLVVILIKTILPPLIASYLFNFGVVAAIAFIMLVYLNNSPEPTTIAAKLVGISLVTILLILGLASVWFTLPLSGERLHSTVAVFIFLVLLSSLSIILFFPFFFRSTLLQPLERLSQGVKAADRGNLEIQIDVRFEDEIGLITHSFNRLVYSLNQATLALKNQAARLERKVAERTAELTFENNERKQTQERLNKQLRYEQAVASCSESLLPIAGDEQSQRQALTEALKHLLTGAQASRAYLLKNFEDADLGPCVRIFVEVCAPDIHPQIDNPANQKFPWSQIPQEMYTSLSTGRPLGGPVDEVLAGSPIWVERFLKQTNPLLSLLCFPIFIHEQWWGSIGFDDCINRRYWDQWEILMLRTGSQILEKTLQRWQVEGHLQDTLTHLEERIRERTDELFQTNIDLRNEIQGRGRIQGELVERLAVESTLAKISSRLLGPLQVKPTILESLSDIGSILHSDRVLFIQLSTSPANMIEDIIEWHEPELPSLKDHLDGRIGTTRFDSIDQLEKEKSTMIDPLSDLPDPARADIELFFQEGVNSLVVTPILVNEQLTALIICSNPQLAKKGVEDRIQSLDVIAGMLGSLIQREAVLSLLEERVADRTRELSAFFEMAMLTSEAADIADILQPALMKIIEISVSDAASIHLESDDESEMSLVAQFGIPKENLAQLQAIHFNQSMITSMNDKGRDGMPSILQTISAAFEISSLPSSTHTPLLARGRVQGILSCYRQSEILYDPYQIIFLQAVGEQLGIAVENHRLRTKVEEAATLHERQRLARELHDAVSQSLYSLTLYARSGRDAFEAGDREKLIDSLEQLELNSITALKEMRLLLYQLRSLAFGEGGLAKAIEARFNLVERRSGIQAGLDIEAGIQLTESVDQELFRLITEALNNALKHSGASQVMVSLRSERERILLEVQDNGQGFDQSQIRPGMGMQNMRERTLALGGFFEIQSQTEHGSRIRIELPMSHTL